MSLLLIQYYGVVIIIKNDRKIYWTGSSDVSIICVNRDFHFNLITLAVILKIHYYKIKIALFLIVKLIVFMSIQKE